MTETAPPHKLLVIKHGAFGDLVQSDGALRDLRSAFPHSEIVLLTTPPFRKLMARCPHIDRILLDSRAPLWKLGEVLQLLRTLRTEDFPLVVDLQKSGRTARYRRLLFGRARWVGKRSGESAPSMIESFRPQLEAAGIAATHCLQPDVSWMADDVSALLAAEGVRDGYITLIPGCAARHPHKRWPHYAELARALLERGLQVVTAPGPDELELARNIPGITLLGPNGFLNWFELAGVLRGARFVVGNDTGPSHVAACLGRPGLALFGPHTSALRTGIRRGAFDALEVPDLQALQVNTVLEHVLSRLDAPA